jgi:glucose-1-phosphate thymidylyltransferase
MKGIVLAGGTGTRLYPVTIAVSKQLLPIYDKPMIYYPISVLMLAGIKDILIISTPDDLSCFKRLLGDGSQFGVNFSYAVQDSPNGIAEAFIIGEEFIGNDSVCLILGDNIFYGNGLSNILHEAIKDTENNKSVIFGYNVSDPERYGVATFDNELNVTSIEEKPNNPKSNYAVVGIYFYPNEVINIAKTIEPSERGELEITEVNNVFMNKYGLKISLLGRGFTWLDTGTFDSFIDASNFVSTVENRQNQKIACLEEIAYNNGWISKEQLIKIANKMKNNQYGKYLMNLI